MKVLMIAQSLEVPLLCSSTQINSQHGSAINLANKDSSIIDQSNGSCK